MTSPETIEGKAYWDKLYKKAGELFGNENITIPTLTRPWIVPDEIVIRETPNNAYIFKATLKVMLEEDYLRGTSVGAPFMAPETNGPDKSDPYGRTADVNHSVGARFIAPANDSRLKILNEYSTQLIRETIIPKLTKEINTSKRYAPLRQVYYSLILAQWFKSRFPSQSVGAAQCSAPTTLGREAISKLINSRNLTNLTSKTPWSKTTYFNEYQKSFKDGEYNIKQPIYSAFGQSIRSYFSGGMNFNIPQWSTPKASSPVQAGPVTAVWGDANHNPSSSPVNLAVEVTGSSPINPDDVNINFGEAFAPSSLPAEGLKAGASSLVKGLPPEMVPTKENVNMLGQSPVGGGLSPIDLSRKAQNPTIRTAGISLVVAKAAGRTSLITRSFIILILGSLLSIVGMQLAVVNTVMYLPKHSNVIVAKDSGSQTITTPSIRRTAEKNTEKYIEKLHRDFPQMQIVNLHNIPNYRIYVRQLYDTLVMVKRRYPRLILLVKSIEFVLGNKMPSTVRGGDTIIIEEGDINGSNTYGTYSGEKVSDVASNYMEEVFTHELCHLVTDRLKILRPDIDRYYEHFVYKRFGPKTRSKGITGMVNIYYEYFTEDVRNYLFNGKPLNSFGVESNAGKGMIPSDIRDSIKERARILEEIKNICRKGFVSEAVPHALVAPGVGESPEQAQRAERASSPAGPAASSPASNPMVEHFKSMLRERNSTFQGVDEIGPYMIASANISDLGWHLFPMGDNRYIEIFIRQNEIVGYGIVTLMQENAILRFQSFEKSAGMAGYWGDIYRERMEQLKSVLKGEGKNIKTVLVPPDQVISEDQLAKRARAYYGGRPGWDAAASGFISAIRSGLPLPLRAREILKYNNFPEYYSFGPAASFYVNTMGFQIVPVVFRRSASGALIPARPLTADNQLLKKLKNRERLSEEEIIELFSARGLQFNLSDLKMANPASSSPLSAVQRLQGYVKIRDQDVKKATELLIYLLGKDLTYDYFMATVEKAVEGEDGKGVEYLLVQPYTTETTLIKGGSYGERRSWKDKPLFLLKIEKNTIKEIWLATAGVDSRRGRVADDNLGRGMGGEGIYFVNLSALPFNDQFLSRYALPQLIEKINSIMVSIKDKDDKGKKPHFIFEQSFNLGIANGLEKHSDYFAWLLTTAFSAGLCFSKDIKIMDGRFWVGGAYLPSFGGIVGGATSFAHEFGHHFYYNLPIGIRDKIRAYAEINEKEQLEGILKRLGIVVGRDSVDVISEFFACEIDRLITSRIRNFEGLRKGVKEEFVQKLVEWEIAPTWLLKEAASSPTMQKMEEIKLQELREGDVGYEEAIAVHYGSDGSIEDIRHFIEDWELKGKNWWLQDNYGQKGVPSEQITIKIGDRAIDIYSWRDKALTGDELKSIVNALGKFAVIADGKALENVRYILIDNDDKVNIKSGEKLNGYGAGSSKAITLYLNAFRPLYFHEMEGINNLDGTIIHELAHSLTGIVIGKDSLHNAWAEKFGWRFLNKARQLKGGATSNYENDGAVVSSYASSDPDEDFCDSLTAALLNEKILDKDGLRGRINFLREHILPAVDSSSLPVTIQRQDSVVVPRIGPVFKFKRTGGLIQIIGDSKTLEQGPASPPAVKETQASSPIHNKGGIDLRALPIAAQAGLARNVGARFIAPETNGPDKSGPYRRTASTKTFNLAAEWQEIQKMLSAGITPSNERIKEYVFASCQRGVLDQQMDSILGCIANIMRIEEDRDLPGDTELRDILVLVDSEKTADELKLSLINISCLSNEPKSIH